MPLLTERGRGLVELRFYKYAAPNGAVTDVPRCEVSGLAVA
jgi:predicted SpoU family rRNA methylase